MNRTTRTGEAGDRRLRAEAACRPHWAAGAVALSLFAILYYFNAYICDDAFIAFRSADNFVRGHGLRWNVGERVQSFTSPLFTLLFSLPYALVHDASDTPNADRVYWVAIALGFILSSASLLVLLRAYGGRPYWVLFALLMSSQAFVTFTSSGLETSLSYLLLALLYALFLNAHDLSRERTAFAVFLCAGLAALNRLDLALLAGPPVAFVFVSAWRRLRWRAGMLLVAGFSPLAAWLAFSLCYFGFLLPNTYYAKLALAAPPEILMSMGWQYLGQSLHQDPVTLAACIAAIAVCWTNWRTLVAGFAVVLHVYYVCSIGGDFIGFRFLAPPFLIAAIIIVDRLRHWSARAHGGWWRSAVALLLIYSAFLPASPLRAFRDRSPAKDVSFYYPASALRHWRPGARFPFARFLRVTGPEECRRLRAKDFTVAIWGNGLNGFCRGPRAHLLDPHGITDPLMARISLPITEHFKPGHQAKAIPVGYAESEYTGQNKIASASLAAYYARLRIVIAGPLWTRERWRAIWELNATAAARHREPYQALPSIPGWMRVSALPPASEGEVELLGPR